MSLSSTRRRLVASTLAPVVLLSACSADPEPSAETTAPSGSTTATSDQTSDQTSAPSDTGERATSSATDAAPPDAAASTSEPRGVATIDTSGLDDDLAEVISGLYAGDDVAATRQVRSALADVRPSTDEPPVPQASVGSWQETPVAVVTAGEDLTLLVEQEDQWRVVGGRWPSLGLSSPVLGGRRHVLLIGSDAREKQGQQVDQLRADSLQVVGVDGQGGGGVLGIARDSWVTMPGGGKAKINNAMVQGGPQAQVETVARVTGLPIEGYVLVGFEGFKGFVDDWDGVQVDAPQSFLSFPEGKQELNGYWALRFSRERKSLPGGDFDRSFNQGVVLAGMGLQARAAGPRSLPPILGMVQEHMQSDLDAEAMLTFAAWAYLAEPTRMGHEVAVGGFGWSDDGQSIVLLDDAARASFDDFGDGNLEE